MGTCVEIRKAHGDGITKDNCILSKVLSLLKEIFSESVDTKIVRICIKFGLGLFVYSSVLEIKFLLGNS